MTFNRRICTACVLCLMLLFQTVSASGWDGYVSEESGSVSIIDFNSLKSLTSNSCIPSESHTKKSNRYSIHWTNHDKSGVGTSELDFSLGADAPSDLSPYEDLKMWIYSEKATGAEIKAIFMSTTKSGESARYIHESFYVDWTGWKLISININSMTKTRNPDITDVFQFRLIANGGWNIVGNPETDLYLATADVVSYPAGNTVSSIYGDETEADTYSALKDSAAFYAGGGYAVTENGKEKITREIEYNHELSCVMMPVSLFEKYFGVGIKKGESYVLTKGDISLSVNRDSAKYLINGIEGTFKSLPYEKNETLYVPGEETAALLGLSSYSYGKFIVIGTESAANAFSSVMDRGVNEKREVASYLSVHEDKTDKDYSTSDLKALKDNWRRYAVGDENVNDMSDPHIKSKIDAYTAEAKAVDAKMIKDENSEKLFTDLVVNSTQNMRTAYENIWAMAKAYGCVGSELYHDKKIESDVLYGLEWLYNRYYGYHQIADDGFWKPTSENWANWDLHVPEALINTLMVLDGADGVLSAEAAKKYLSYFDLRNPNPKMVSMNYAYITISIMGSAALQGDIEKVRKASDWFESVYLYVDGNTRMMANYLDTERRPYYPERANGFYTDGSYIMHTLTAYTGVYGKNHLYSICRMRYLTDGTVFECDNPQKDNTVKIIYDNIRPVTAFATTGYRMLQGRVTTIDNYTMGARYFADVINCLNGFDDYDKKIIMSMIKKSASEEFEKTSFYSLLNLDGVKVFEEILSDESVTPEEDVYKNKVFPVMDKVTHEQGDWAIGISMSSRRTFNYESINNENQTGWYLSDGMTEYYLKGKTDNATATYWNQMDPYRRPGTTVDTQKREALSIDQSNTYLSSKEFVGGVSLASQYGTAAMELESYHADKPIGVSGVLNPVHKNDLTARKSYFMFDDETVCLGTAVNASDNNNAEVLTIVDNVLSDESKIVSGEDAKPYKTVSVSASVIPEPEHVPENTIDDDITESRWTSEEGGEITWDLGEVKNCGYATLAFKRGSVRKQYFTLSASTDGANWTVVFDGESSGDTELPESFSLGGTDARYIKFTNKGNSAANSSWVAITDCKIYPVNSDGSMYLSVAEAYGTDKVIADGAELDIKGDDFEPGDVLWMNVAGKCGYYFPKESRYDNTVLKARRTSGVNSFFELWYSHGVNPSDGKYAYVLLPGKSAEQTQKYAENSPIKILANTDDIQAVRNEKLSVTSIVFWQKGSFEGITVDKPCMVMIRDKDGKYEISVSDPTQKLSDLNVKINRALEPVSADEKAEASSDNGTTSIKYDMTGSEGRTMECVFAADKIAAS